MPEGLTLGLAVLVSISAPLSGWIAFRRDRPPLPWFVFGALGGPLAIAVLLLAPPGACPRCDTVVFGWPASCTACGRPFRRHWRARRTVPWAAGSRVTTGVPVMRPPDPSEDRPPARPLLAPVPDPVAPTPEVAVLDRHADDHPGAGHHGTSAVEPGLHIVASGIFTGGAAHLEIGYRYGIGRDGDHLVVVGPVDQTPMEVRASLPLDTVDLLSIDDRVTIATRGNSRGRLVMAFSLAAGIRGKALEEALADVTAGVAAGHPG